MDTSRLIINTIDKSSYNVEEETSLVGFTVVEAPKGPINPVRIPAGGSAKLKDIFGVSSKDYPELFEVETFNKEYDVIVSAPYSDDSTVNVAYVTNDGIFPGANSVKYTESLEKVILGLEDDLSADVPSKFGISDGSTVKVLKDYRYSASNNFGKAEKDLGSGVYPGYKVGLSDEDEKSYLVIDPGFTLYPISNSSSDSSSDSNLTYFFRIKNLNSSYISDFTVDVPLNIVKSNNVEVGKVEDNVIYICGPSSSVDDIISQEYIKSYLDGEEERSVLEVYWIDEIDSSKVHGVICPKYVSNRDLHISFAGFNSLTNYRSNNPLDRNILKMTVYEDGAFRDSSHKLEISGSLRTSDKDSSGNTLGFVDSNSSYYNQDLIYVYTVKEFSEGDLINTNISKYPPLHIYGGNRVLSEDKIELHNKGWEKALDSDYSDVDVFFDSFNYSDYSLGELSNSNFFTLVSNNSDGHNLSGYIFNYSVDPSTIENFNKNDNYLSFGRNYWNICNQAVISLSDGSKFFSTMTGARALMQCRIIENRWGGSAPMWENEGYPGLGGQLNMINPVRLRYKYTKSQLDVLDKYNYNPVINDRQYGVMVVSQKTCKEGSITDWSYIGHACAFFNFIKQIRSNVMIPQIGKANNPYYRELRAKQVTQYLRQRLEGANRIWAEASVDTSTADGVNDLAARKALKFVINVSVKVDIFSEFVELNFTNEDQSTSVSYSESYSES